MSCMVRRHRLTYSLLNDELQNGLHALSIEAKTPAEVCRKLEGKKYELARKLKINVVNHRWVEDCVKQGRRISKRPYMNHSRLVIGLLLLEIPDANEVRSVFGEASTSKSFSKNRVIDVESDDGGDDDWTQSLLLKE
ncbi:BRCT domain-containing protein, partial [Tanacetum coccineum]